MRESTCLASMRNGPSTATGGRDPTQARTAVDRTLGSVLKYEEDQDAVRADGLEHLVGSGD